MKRVNTKNAARRIGGCSCSLKDESGLGIRSFSFTFRIRGLGIRSFSFTFRIRVAIKNWPSRGLIRKVTFGVKLIFVKYSLSGLKKLFFSVLSVQRLNKFYDTFHILFFVREVIAKVSVTPAQRKGKMPVVSTFSKLLHISRTSRFYNSSQFQNF